jgi:hypothetical protein
MRNMSKYGGTIASGPAFGVVALLAVVACTMIMPSRSQSQPPASKKSRTAPALKAWAPPKTNWGDPDIQGMWPGTDLLGVPLQRDPKLGTRAFLNDEEYAKREARAQQSAQNDAQPYDKPDERAAIIGSPIWWLEHGKPTRQASLIVEPADGRIPPLTQEAIKLDEARDAKFRVQYGVDRRIHGSNDSWIDDVLALVVEPYESNLFDRCISRGVIGSILPGEPGGYNLGNQIIQAPGLVVIRYEMIHEARVIPVDGRPHGGSGIRTYMGDPRGHWEGNTLVVETANFLGGKLGLLSNGAGIPYSDELVLIERFTRVAEDTLNYEAVVNDPRTYTKSWKIAFPLHRDPNYQMVEYACHEGNYGLEDMVRGVYTEQKATESPRQEAQ